MFVKNNMVMRFYWNKMTLNKNGLSGVITTVLMIALAMAAVVIVWTVVNNIVSDKLEETESCFGVFGKISINSRYTCYNESSNEFQFSVSIGDIDVGEVLVSISGEGQTQSFKLDNEAKVIDGLIKYPDRSTSIKLPGKNSGLTYIFEMTGAGFSEAPDSISLVPVINGKQCEVADSLSQIDSCSALA